MSSGLGAVEFLAAELGLATAHRTGRGGPMYVAHIARPRGATLAEPYTNLGTSLIITLVPALYRPFHASIVAWAWLTSVSLDEAAGRAH